MAFRILLVKLSNILIALVSCSFYLISRHKKSPVRANLQGFIYKSGDVLLSHGRTHTIIGANWFHFWVRDGIRWFTVAMVTRKLVRNSCQLRSRDSITIACSNLVVVKGGMMTISTLYYSLRVKNHWYVNTISLFNLPVTNSVESGICKMSFAYKYHIK